MLDELMGFTASSLWRENFHWRSIREIALASSLSQGSCPDIIHCHDHCFVSSLGSTLWWKKGTLRWRRSQSLPV